jgi:hypothetical protein
MGAASFFDLSRRRRSVSLAFMVFCIFAVLSLLRRNDELIRPAKWGLDFQHTQPEPTIQSTNQTLDLTHLEKHDLTPSFSYSRRTIKTKIFDGKRETLTTINATLFPTPRMLDREQLSDTTIVTPPPLTLRVPSSPEIDTSITSFGIATSAERLPSAFPNLKHWLSNTSSLLHVALAASDEDKLWALQAQLDDLSINGTINPTTLPFSKAYFSLIKELYDSRTPNTQWIVLIDDDTFIPSLPALINRLNTAYDSTQELLISAASDNIDQIHTFGLQPFGGGGIFLSVPLAASLVQPEIWKSCMSSSSGQGDQIVNECLQGHSPVRPIFDQGLNQMDITGDFYTPAGYFESGRQMLTIHHWRSWFFVDMPAVSAVSKACGYEGVLMRWKFAGDVVLSNGYSITEYPKGITDSELAGVEQTWPGRKEQFIHRIGPLREKLERDRKRTYGMVATAVTEEGMRQTYVERAEGVSGMEAGEDKVVELVWLFE